jgi:hypothetical protein
MDSKNVPMTPDAEKMALPTPAHTLPKKKTLMDTFGNHAGHKRLRFRQEESPSSTPAHSIHANLVPASPFEHAFVRNDVPAVPETAENVFIDNVDSLVAYLERHHMVSFHRAILTSQQVKEQNNAMYSQHCISIVLDPIMLICHNGNCPLKSY